MYNNHVCHHKHHWYWGLTEQISTLTMGTQTFAKTAMTDWHVEARIEGTNDEGRSAMRRLVVRRAAVV